MCSLIELASAMFVSFDVFLRNAQPEKMAHRPEQNPDQWQARADDLKRSLAGC
jgi:hypothetical protein